MDLQVAMAGKPEDMKVKLYLFLIGTGSMKSMKHYILYRRSQDFSKGGGSHCVKVRLSCRPPRRVFDLKKS